MRSTEGSFIDFGFISTELNIINTGTRKQLNSELFSDHAAIFLNINIEPVTKEPLYIKNYQQAKWTKMQSYINKEITKMNIPTQRNMSKNEINNHTEKVNKIYQDAINKFIPNIQINSNTIKLSNQTLKLIKTKKKHYYGKNIETRRNQ